MKKTVRGSKSKYVQSSWIRAASDFFKQGTKKTSNHKFCSVATIQIAQTEKKKIEKLQLSLKQ